MDIALDVDGPLAALHLEWLRRYNRDYDDALTVGAVASWNMHEHVKPECGKRIYEYLNAADLYEHVPVEFGAGAAVDRLRASGHQIFFLTSCTKGMVDQKADWLMRYRFVLPGTRSGRLPSDMFVFDDKKRFQADLLIDDALHNINAWTGSGKRAVLMNFPWNDPRTNAPVANPALVHRASGWAEVIEYIERDMKP